MSDAAVCDEKLQAVLVDVLNGWDADKLPNRRSKQRRPYPCMQAIGLIIDGEYPKKKDFKTVRCHDLSEGGISFFLEDELSPQMVVLALGSLTSPTYLLAEVRYSRIPAGPSPSRYLVGCKFLRRVDIQ